MWVDEEYEKRRKKEEEERKAQAGAWRIKIAESNKLLDPPDGISDEERTVWLEIANQIVTSTSYLKTAADVEIVRQYVQTRVLRDRAWTEYNKSPERYSKIVTGICADGKTPKVLVKENEHYKTLTDCNKQLEKTLKELRLTPLARSKR